MRNGGAADGRCSCNRMQAADRIAQPLCEVQVGKLLKVAGISGGRRLMAQMAQMGIYPGVEMRLLCAGCGSPCVIRVHGGTLSLGLGISQNIMVESVV